MSCWRNLLKIILKISKYNVLKGLIAVFVVFFSFSIVHAEQQEHRKAVVVIVNFTNFEEFKNTHHMRDLMENGAIGLMNTRGFGKSDTIRAHATLGWGTRADALWEHCTVVKNAPFLFVQNIDDIVQFNNDNSYNVCIGALGDFFRGKGLKTAVIGGQVFEGRHYAPGALIAMDSNGVIDDGEIGQAITDFDVLFDAFEEKYRQNHLLVLDTGNISKWASGSPDPFDIDKGFVLRNVNVLIRKIVNVIEDDPTLLIVLSPHYNAHDAKQGRRLTPVVFWGKDIEKGLLISDTTRRPGIVGNIDIAPAIARFFDGRLEQVTGEPVQVKASDRNIDKVTALHNLTAFNAKNRGVVLQGYITLQIVLLLLTLILFLLPKKYAVFSPRASLPVSRHIPKILRAFILFILICPFTLFMMPLLHIDSLAVYVVLLIVFNSAAAYGIYKLCRHHHTRMICISVITAVVILVDLIIQGPLNKSSLLGYDAVIGARYYGLGNEYMGILIAAVLLAVVPLVYKKILPKWIGMLIFISVIPIIGLSAFGANVGGTITATVAFGFAVLNIYRKKLSVKNVLGIIGVMILVVSAFAVYDIYFSAQKSHLAKAIITFEQQGFQVILDIIGRKMAMNLKLLRWTIWSRVLLVSVLVIIVLLLKPKGLLHQFLSKYSSFSVGWYAIVVASIIGMLVNDSGVVVAATANIFLIFSLLYFILMREEDS